MATTTRHALPTPDGSNAPTIPVHMKALADAIDVKLPYVSASEPTKVSGLVWRNPTTGLTKITDGSSWYAINKAEHNGSFNVSVGVGASVTTAVTWPAGKFGVAPNMRAFSTSSRLNFAFTNVTTTGCDVIASNFTSGTSGSVPVNWTAEEKL